MDRVTTRFKQAILAPELLVMPGGFSPLHARMAERLEFQGFFMSGSQVAAYVHGLPDIGLLGLGEMVEAARRLASGTAMPIFADADTGYGNALNVRHTVQQYIRAGVAGLHIEDQEAPKKSGTKAGRRCIPLDEAVGKYRAAVDARNELDPDFIICARCDLIGAEDGSFEAAVERCIAYLEEGGVDLVWLNTVQSRDEIGTACGRIPGPVLPLYGGPGPAPTLEEYRALGAAAVLFPALTPALGCRPPGTCSTISSPGGPRPSRTPRSGRARAAPGRWALPISSPRACRRLSRWSSATCPRTNNAITRVPSAIRAKRRAACPRSQTSGPAPGRHRTAEPWGRRGILTWLDAST